MQRGSVEHIRSALARIAERRAPLRQHFLKLVQRNAEEAQRRGLRLKPETLASIDAAIRREASTHNDA